MGHEVADVIMLDTYSPRHLKSANSSASEILGSALGVSLTDSSTADLSQAPEADTDSYITKLYQMGQQSGIVPNDLTIQLFSALYRVSIQNHTFASQYEVENITANVHHFTAADNVTGVNSGASWAGILNLDSINVPGGHESMMQGSNAPELADRILLRLGQDNNNNE
jgi:thioesterase domain-containing protein